MVMCVFQVWFCYLQGFDVDLSKLRNTFSCGSIDLEDDNFVEPDSEDETNRDWLNTLCKMAVSFYKEKTVSKLKRLKDFLSALVCLFDEGTYICVVG